MNLDHAHCYGALRTRDPRFDGRFFTGVTSTGVYCRPICPARTPKPEHCRFFACAAAAEEAGFRACRRCRPETTPGTPAWSGTSATVDRAVRLIAAGALDSGGVEDLAARLGLGGRQVRRLFQEHLGVSPAGLARTRRAHFANQLLIETDLAMGQVALAAGYPGTRRFNAAMRQVFDATPTEIRQRRRTRAHAATDCGQPGPLTVRLAAHAPLDWRGLLAFLAPRAIPGVEMVAGDTYRRSFRLGDVAGIVSLAPAPDGTALRLQVPLAAAAHLATLVQRARHLADLDADVQAIGDVLADQPRLRPLIKRHGCPRVPGAWDPFETAVRAILGQQITVAAATTLAGRLVAQFGDPLPDPPAGGPQRLFPRPAVLADADLSALGVPRTRAATLQHLARAVAAGRPVLEPAPDLAAAVARLVALPGIGDWTAHYVAMRALHEPDALPAGDLVLRQALADGGVLPTPAAVTRLAEPWRPWRAYAAMLIWRHQSRRKDPR
ncbi:MAG: AlkA N-terminal domain-containing protein [Candidatus Krumholzibacteriia bacterium]